MEIRLILAILVLWTVAVLTDTNINRYGNGGTSHSRSGSQDSAQSQNRAQAYKALRNNDSHNTLRDQLAELGQKYQGAANQYGQGSRKASAGGSAAAQQFAKHDATYDEIANQINDASKYADHQSQSVGKYDKLDDDRAKGYNAANAKKKAYNRGKVFNDNISYGFDKKYSQDLSERGGFEEETGHRKHKLDDYRDKQKARKLIRGEHSAANARQDSQRALKENKYSQNAAQKQAANGKYGKSDKKLDKAGATQDSQSVLYDRKDSKYNEQEQGRQQAINKNNQFAGKDKVFGRQAAASKAGAQGHADKKYYGGHRDKGGATGTGVGYTAANIGGGTHGQGSNAGAQNHYNENADQLDQGKEHLAQKAGASEAALKEYNQGKKKEDFSQVKSLRDQRTGKFAQGVHNAENKGYHDRNSQAAKSVAGAGRKYADASAQSKAKAAKNDLNEQLFDRENIRRHQQDENDNYKKLKRFYHDKKTGGNNFERLKYTRKRVENEFGSTEAAQKEHQNQFDKAHMSAKHNSAQRKDNYAKSNRASRDYKLRDSDKASSGNAANHAQNFNKAAQKSSGQKKNVAESDYNNNRANVQQRHQGRHDNSAGSSSQNADGYQSANVDQKESRGGNLGERDLRSGIRGIGVSSADRGYSKGIQANVGSVGSSNSGYQGRGGNTGYQAQGYSNDYQGRIGNGKIASNTGRNNYGNSGGSRFNKQRSINVNNGGRYGNNNYNDNNNNNNNQRYSQARRGTGVSGGLFSSGLGLNNRGGLFGQGFSNFGNTYASRSGTRNSVPHRGTLFTSSFGRSFRKPNTFSSSLGSRSSFAFHPRFKGNLF